MTILYRYWNANGYGLNAASSMDFTDFRAFGTFTTPAVKQYSIKSNICGTTVNHNIFSTTASKKAKAISKKSENTIVVGNLQF